MTTTEFEITTSANVNVEDCNRQTQRARNRARRERKANAIATTMVFIFSIVTSLVTFYGALTFVYKVFNPGLYNFLIAAMFIGAADLAVFGVCYEYVKERIYRKR